MSEEKFTLNHLDYLTWTDEQGKSLYGCSQERYKDEWKIKAGCGPTSAANHLIYLIKTKRVDLPYKAENLDDYLVIMDEIWKYITPTIMGVNKASIYESGLKNFFKDHGINSHVEILEVANRFINYDGVEAIIKFIVEAIKDDRPVSMLNLINKYNGQPDGWHWVTIVGIEVVDNYRDGIVSIYDGYDFFKVSLADWFNSRLMGGAFVKFKLD